MYNKVFKLSKNNESLFITYILITFGKVELLFLINNKTPFVESWTTIILLLLLLTVAFLGANYRKQFNNLFRTLFIRGLIAQLVREESAILTRIQIVMNSIYFLLLSLIVNKIVSIGFGSTMLLFGVIFFVYLIKYFSMGLLGNLFKLPKIASEYSFNVFLLNVFNGLLLLPLSIGVYYIGVTIVVNCLLYVSIVIVCTSFIIRLLKLVQVVSVHKSVSILYLFIYICTLEILPLLIGGKYLIIDSKLF